MGETNIVFQLKLNLFYHSAKCDKPDQISDEQNVAAIHGRSGIKCGICKILFMHEKDLKAFRLFPFH